MMWTTSGCDLVGSKMVERWDHWNPRRLIFEETSMKLLKLTSEVIALRIYIYIHIYEIYFFVAKAIAFFFAYICSYYYPISSALLTAGAFWI